MSLVVKGVEGPFICLSKVHMFIAFYLFRSVADFGTQLVVLYTVEPLYRGYHWDPAGCPVLRGVLNSEVDLQKCGRDSRQCPHYRDSLYSECPL